MAAKAGSAVEDAIASVETFQKELSSFFGVLHSALAGGRLSATPSDIDGISLAVLNAGVEVEKALVKVESHQVVQRQGEGIKTSIHERTMKVRAIGKCLSECESKLEMEVKRAQALLSDSSQSTAKVDVKSILQLAKKLSYITHAPRAWHHTQNRPLPGRFRAPAPQIDDMKKSTLFETPESVVEQLRLMASVSENGDSGPVDDVEWEAEEEGDEDAEHQNKRVRLGAE